jgi:hypothetical protein
MLDKLMKLLQAKERDNYVEKKPRDVYRGISHSTKLSKEEAAMIGGLESQHGKYEKNMGGGSASGIMQVMPNLAKMIRPGSEKRIMDRNVQQELASDIINMNEPTIKQIAAQSNKTADVVDRYALYNLGKGRGRKFLEASDDTPIEKILPAAIIKANPKLYKHKTVGDAKKAMKVALTEGGKTNEFYPDIQDLFTGMGNGEEE